MAIPLSDEIVAMAQADAKTLFEAALADTRQRPAERRGVAQEWAQRLMTDDPAELLQTLADAELNGIPDDEIAAWYAGRGGRRGTTTQA